MMVNVKGSGIQLVLLISDVDQVVDFLLEDLVVIRVLRSRTQARPFLRHFLGK
jgi:hypothetical protein